MANREFPKEYIKDELLISSPFWRDALASLTRPAALQLVARLSPSHPCGIDPNEHGVKMGGRDGDTPVDTLLRSKQTRPNAIHLIRVGEFYEFGHGVCSVLAIEHTGLRQMGNGVPRAGTPIANLQPTVDALTRAGYSVVVFEQMDAPGKKTKSRFISQILTPSSPVYTYGLLLDSSRDAAFPEVPPVFGLAQGLRGISLVEVLPDLEMVCLTDGLTWEAARARLERFGSQAGKIYMHDSLGVASFLHQMVVTSGEADGKGGAKVSTGENISELIGRNFTSIEKVSGVRAADFPRAVENLVKLDLNLSATTPYKVVSRPGGSSEGRPRPLYLGTATQIGLLPMRGVPDLVEQMLPKNVPQICRGILKDLLLTPPPYEVADAVRSIIKQLENGEEALPDFKVSSAARYIRTIHAREASASILRDLHALSSDFLAANVKPDKSLGKVSKEAMRVVSHIAALSMELERAKEGALAATSVIGAAVSFGEDDPAYKPTCPLIPGELFSTVEREFRGHLLPGADADLAAAYREVDQAARAYEACLVEDFALLSNEPAVTEEQWNAAAYEQEKIARHLPKFRLAAKTATKKKVASLVYDYHDEAIWLKDRSAPGELIHPLDRFGKVRSDRYSTARVESALMTYRRATAAAKIAVEKVLRRVSDELSPRSAEILAVVTYSNLLKTLTSHLTEVLPKGWSSNVEITDEHVVEVEGLFPYWMRRKDAVLNNVALSGVTLLTGPNMAGKSTLLRSLSVSLLSGAAAGLLVPAARLKTRRVRSVTARISSQDDSENSLSSFGVECLDIKAVLRDCVTADSDDGMNWVAVDELGKGTDSRAGSALAGAVLEELSQRRIISIFATHWWELWDLPVKLDDIPSFHMEVKNGQSTHKILSGTEFTSLAFDVAERLGLPPEVVKRAREISTFYHPIGRPLSEQARPSDGAPEAHGSLAPEAPSFGEARRLLCAEAGVSDQQLRLVPPSLMPPLKDMGQSCLYVLRTNNGYYYVGETDDIAGRLASHRKDKRKTNGEIVYALIAKGKSHARKHEASLIAALLKAGFPMLSSNDVSHRNFGGE